MLIEKIAKKMEIPSATNLIHFHLNKLFKSMVCIFELYCLPTVLATFQEIGQIFFQSSGHPSHKLECLALWIPSILVWYLQARVEPTRALTYLLDRGGGDSDSDKPIITAIKSLIRLALNRKMAALFLLKYIHLMNAWHLYLYLAMAPRQSVQRHSP